MNVADWLAAAARQRPGAPALLLGRKMVRDYAGFAGIASAIACSLRDEHRVRPGDRVAIYMANSTQYLECLFGVLWAGAVVVPVNAKLHGREAWTILRDADLAAVFVSPSSAEQLRTTRVPEDASLPLLDVTADTHPRAATADPGTPAKVEWNVKGAWSNTCRSLAFQTIETSGLSSTAIPAGFQEAAVASSARARKAPPMPSARAPEPSTTFA